MAVMTWERSRYVKGFIDRRRIRKWQRGDPIPDIDAELRNAPGQRDVWHYIDEWKGDRQGNPPPRSDIAASMNCTVQNIDLIISRLERRGFIELDEYGQPMIPWKKGEK